MLFLAVRADAWRGRDIRQASLGPLIILGIHTGRGIDQ